MEEEAKGGFGVVEKKITRWSISQGLVSIFDSDAIDEETKRKTGPI